MASLIVQFHATIEELAQFTSALLADSAIEALAVRYRPFEVTTVSREDAKVILFDLRVLRLIFTRGPGNPTSTGNLDLLDVNPGALVLDVGREGATGMSESCLKASVGRAVWKRALAELNRLTTAGVVGVHEETGASAVYRAHRLSPGAVKLSTSGVALRPFPASAVVLRPLQY